MVMEHAQAVELSFFPENYELVEASHKLSLSPTLLANPLDV